MLSIIVGMVYFMLDILRTDLWSKCSSKEEPLWQRTTNEIKWMGFNEFTINIGLEKWNEFQSLQIWLGILGKLQFWESFTGKIWIQVNLDLPEVDPYSINPFAPGDFAEKRVLKLVEWFSGHCRAIKS